MEPTIAELKTRAPATKPAVIRVAGRNLNGFRKKYLKFHHA